MWSSKALIIAAHEFSTAVRSKAFLIGVIFFPMVVVIMILVRSISHAQNDAASLSRMDRKFAVLDHTQVLYADLADAARQRNQSLTTGGKGSQGGLFLPVSAVTGGKPLPEVRAALAARVRGGELFAFVEIPASVIDTAASAEPVLYYSDKSVYDDLLPWIRLRLDEQIRVRYLRDLSVDPALAERLTSGISVQGRDVFEGIGREASESGGSKFETFAVPFGLTGLLFVVILGTTPALFNSVMEEKVGRVSEVMLGSVTPFELMAGKLIGNLGVSLMLAAIYIVCGYFAAVVYGYAHLLSLDTVLVFAFFLVIAIALFGSLFIAVGSICDDGKDAQSLMMPMMLLMVLPILMLPALLNAPDGNLMIGLSLFPTTAPFVMPLRLALPSPVPLWQMAASLGLAGAFTVACVWAAGKIFRTAILIQGKSLSVVELWRLMRS